MLLLGCLQDVSPLSCIDINAKSFMCKSRSYQLVSAGKVSPILQKTEKFFTIAHIGLLTNSPRIKRAGLSLAVTDRLTAEPNIGSKGRGGSNRDLSLVWPCIGRCGSFGLNISSTRHKPSSHIQCVLKVLRSIKPGLRRGLSTEVT